MARIRLWRIPPGCLFLLSCLSVPVSCFYGLSRTDQGRHAAGVRWLPREAVDVSYYRSYGYTCYEFTISERGFLAWARERKWNIRPITVPVTVPRFTRMVVPSPVAPVGFSGDWAKFYRDFKAWEAQSKAVIPSGWTDSVRWGDGGGYVVAYDRTSGRAYFQANPR